MAISSAICTSFKQELLVEGHNLTNGADSLKLALYTSSATLGATTTAFVTTGEVASSGTYATGGSALTNVTPTSSGTVGFCDFSDLSYTTATITARGCLIYNSSQSNKAVCALDFGGIKSSSSGTFTIQFPTAASSTAIIRIS